MAQSIDFYGERYTTEASSSPDHMIGLNFISGTVLNTINLNEGNAIPLGFVSLEYEKRINERFSLGARIVSLNYQDSYKVFEKDQFDLVTYETTSQYLFAGNGTGVGFYAGFHPFAMRNSNVDGLYFGLGFDISTIDWEESINFIDSPYLKKYNRILQNDVFFFNTIYSKVGWKRDLTERYYIDSMITFGVFGSPRNKLFSQGLQYNNDSKRENRISFIQFFTPSATIGLKF